MKKRIILILSISCLVYFSIIIYMSSKNIAPNPFLRGLLELITLPYILLTIAILVISIIEWGKEKWLIQSGYLFSFIISLITISLMIVATILDV